MTEQNLYHCRQWLKRKYEEEGLTLREIAQICNVDHKTIYYRLKKYGINTERKINPEMERTYFYLRRDFMNSLRGFSNMKQQSMNLIITDVMTKHMLGNNYNPFTNREFEEKND